MATSQRDVRNRIDAVKNIQKITRAMEMVAAARLRRAEQRIEALRPYADAIRRMTRDAAAAAGKVPNMPVLTEHESVENVGLLLVAGDRVIVIGYTDFPGRMASQSSTLYATNIRHMIADLTPGKDGNIVHNMADDVIRGATVAFAGETTFPPPPPKVQAFPPPPPVGER